VLSANCSVPLVDLGIIDTRAQYLQQQLARPDLGSRYVAVIQPVVTSVAGRYDSLHRSPAVGQVESMRIGTREISEIGHRANLLGIVAAAWPQAK
jgi:hypothetical protein